MFWLTLNLRSESNCRMSNKSYYFLNLGCPKNQTDGDFLRGILKHLGLAESDEPAGVDYIIVNTCAFIEQARQETKGEIKELLPYKKDGTRLVAVGCYPVLYNIQSEISDIDAAFGLNRVDDFLDYIAGKGIAQRILGSCWDQVDIGRVRPDLPYAYVKISDGCDNRCSYCTIPMIRGPYRSIPPVRVIKEVEALAAGGVKEIVLVAQDSCVYGRDLDVNVDLADLCCLIARVDGIEWIRIMYAHPAHLSDALMDRLFAIDKVCHYLDMPIQHISEKILKMMRRRSGTGRIKQIIKRLRNIDKSISLRTTMMVGFPGETDDDYRRLLDFVEETEFDYLGAFCFSPEDKAEAIYLSGAVDPQLAEERYELLIDVAERVASKRAIMQIGERQKLLIERLSSDNPAYFEARSYRQAPDIDGFYKIPIRSSRSFKPDIKPGMFVNAVISDSDRAEL